MQEKDRRIGSGIREAEAAMHGGGSLRLSFLYPLSRSLSPIGRSAGDGEYGGFERRKKS